jgi:adventurous gliding motility protein agmX
MEACRSALGQVVSSGRITDASIGKTGKNSKGEQQFEVKGQLRGTLAATGKNGTHDFTCSAVYHQSNNTYEASVTVDL